MLARILCIMQPAVRSLTRASFPLREVLAAAVLLTFNCTAGAAAESKWLWPNMHPRSGFEGTTLVKVICANTPPAHLMCPFYSAHADFSVYSDLGESVGTFASDASGLFRIALKP